MEILKEHDPEMPIAVYGTAPHEPEPEYHPIDPDGSLFVKELFLDDELMRSLYTYRGFEGKTMKVLVIEL